MSTPAIMVIRAGNFPILSGVLLALADISSFDVASLLAVAVSYNVTGLFIVYVKLLHPFNLHSKVYVHAEAAVLCLLFFLLAIFSSLYCQEYR